MNPSLLSEKTDWISVKDKLPELTEQVYWYNDDNERVPWEGEFKRHVLANCSKRGIIKARYNGRTFEEVASFGQSSIVFVTHWMPLPEPPKVEKGLALSSSNERVIKE